MNESKEKSTKINKKVVIITGSSSGIGKATAKYFAEKGWQVVATMRSPEKEEELAENKGIELMKLDVTDTKQREEVVAKTVKQYGRVDALVNNAGYGLVGPFETIEPEQIEQQFKVNVLSLFEMTRAVLAQMKSQRSGVIINISSMGGRLAIPMMSPYHSTKFAVEGFSESIQYELNKIGMRVKLVEPGTIKTDFYGRSLVDGAKDEDKVPEEYAKLYESFNKTMDTAGSSGADPKSVAKVIYKAATDKSKRLRYPAAGGAGILTFMRKYSPDAVFRRVTELIFSR
ncbi:MAG: SDR family oxidoreductase [Candidatus Dojkabacteria bacterium]